MALHAEEPRMLLQLHDLDEAALEIPAADHQAGLFQAGHIVVVHLETVAVALRDDLPAVSLAGERAGLDLALVGAEAHRAALEDDMALLVHQRDDRMRRLHVELRRVGVPQPEHVAGKLDDRHLHAETEAGIGNLFLPGVARGGDLALDAAIADTTGHQDAVYVLQALEPGIGLQALGVDAHDLHAAVVGDAGVAE